MALIVFNKSGSPVTLSGLAPVVPASASPPDRGPGVNVTSELRGLTGTQYTNLETQRLAAPLEYEWTSGAQYAIGTLTASGVLVAELGSADPLPIGLIADSGESDSAAHDDHAHALHFATVQAVLAAADSNLDINGKQIIVGTPTQADHVATKAYADAISSGLSLKKSVRVLADSNIALSGAQTIDGVSVVATNRVLVAGQSTGSQNGIYVAAAGAWARASDLAAAAHAAGTFAFVNEGTTYAETGWVCTTDGPIDAVGTDSLAFTQFSAAGTLTAGAGLTKTGDRIDIVANADGSILVAADDVKVGVLATDVQHGARGGGTQHALVISAGAAGFMSGADKALLDDLTAGPTVQGTAADQSLNGFEYQILASTTDVASVTVDTAYAPQAGHMAHIDGTVSAMDRVAGKVFSKNVAAVVKNVGGTVSTVGTPIVAGGVSDATLATCTLTFSIVAGTLNVTFAPPALYSGTIEWLFAPTFDEN